MVADRCNSLDPQNLQMKLELAIEFGELDWENTCHWNCWFMYLLWVMFIFLGPAGPTSHIKVKNPT